MESGNTFLDFPHPDDDNHGATILVVDDDRFILKMFTSILQAKGYQPVCATNGMEGLQMAKKIHPDLIFLDIMMPRMDGFETLRKLRQIREFEDTPIIIVTAKADTNTFLKAIKLGANDFIAKPFSKADLLRKLRFALNQAAQQKGLARTTNGHIPLYNVTFVDPKIFANLQKKFILKFENTFLGILKIINRGEKVALRKELSDLRDACEYYEFPRATRILDEAMGLLERGDWPGILHHLDELYQYFQSLRSEMTVESGSAEED
ncbi:MAG: response regulator [Calditrichaeota bacterium]|nr:response regulator [Calditrichota bacterium]